jgi:hypothetical protein
VIDAHTPHPLALFLWHRRHARGATRHAATVGHRQRQRRVRPDAPDRYRRGAVVAVRDAFRHVVGSTAEKGMR